MNQGKKKIILGLIGLCCLGNSWQVEATPVLTAEELAANGGVININATDTAHPAGDGRVFGIWNQGNGIDFIYTGETQINIIGYDSANEARKIGILSESFPTASDLTLGKTTLIWCTDSADTEIRANIYGVHTYLDSTITLGGGSLIDIEGITGVSISGVRAGEHGMLSPDEAGTRPGSIALGDDTKIILKNNGTGYTKGIDSSDGNNVVAGNNLYINVLTEMSESRGVEVNFKKATLSVGSNATIIAKSSNGTAIGVLVYDTGSMTVQENLIIEASAVQEAFGIHTWGFGEVYLNGATISAAAGDGSYALYSDSDGKIVGNYGEYNLIGDVVADEGSIKMDFAKGSRLKGAARMMGRSGVSIDYKMEETTWEMTKNSQLSNLNFVDNSSNIIFAGDSAFKTLTINNLSGTNGNFTMRTDIVGDGAGNNGGDFINVTGTSAGEHTVTVQNNGAANATGDETLTIIRTADGVATFTNSNVVELGGYEFNLRDVAGTNQHEWELFGAKKGGKASQPGSAAVNLFAGSYLLNYAETQTLMKRMGDLRDGKESGNVWGRVYGGKFHSNSDSFLKDFDINYSGVQVGADKKFVREDGKGVVYLGGFFGYSKGDIDYGYGSGDVDSKSLGAYWTHMHNNGFYADIVFKYGWMENDFDVLDSQGAKVTGKDISTQGFTGSMEVGRRYHFDQKDKEGWYVEPQAQLTVSHQNGDSFTASNGLNVKVDSFRSVMGRVGAHIGYEVKGGKNPVNIYGKVSVVKEFDGDVNYSFNGSPEMTSYKDTWVVYGVGATAKLGTRHNLYLDVERATGGQFTQSWGVNGGYRYAW